MDKKEIRRWIREKKRSMTNDDIENASNRLALQLFEHPIYQKASTVYGYLSYNQEVRTMGILQRALADGKAVAVPKVFGDEMRFIRLDDLSAVAEGYCGIPEPVADEPVAGDPFALVLMPGLAFDKEGHRIGYGGGFYDRFLAREKTHPTVALCYGFQMMDSLETEAHDLPVDVVLWDDFEV